MPERRDSYSNPQPPQRHYDDDDDDEADDRHRLTNEDFRKLLMAPKTPSGSTTSQVHYQTKSHEKREEDLDEVGDEEESSATLRRKRKLYYAKIMKQKEDREKELSQKYRDRARERRDGQNNDYDQTEMVSTTADYKAVAPDAKLGEDYAERRKQVIQESKYLGGDMEHTHLVKGLDYALLEKVRAEINSKEVGDEDLENAVKQKEYNDEDEEQLINFKTKLGRNIYRQIFRSKPPLRNDLFLPGRMAYVIDLEDEYADTDVPTTLIRSKADCPTLEATMTLSTNDIVINKLTKILTYLRHDRKEIKKQKKKDKLKDDKSKVSAIDESIYEDLGDYVASRSYDRPRVKDERGQTHRHKDRDGGPERSREKKRPYFEKPTEEEDDHEKFNQMSAKEYVKTINERFKGFGNSADPDRVVRQEQERAKKLKAKTEIDSYAECYPGMLESADAIGDSDDEVDYTKMDQGTKKGPVGRWDFDTHEEYSNYMSKREALPKAAFQYGVKMSDGRKTRRGGPKDEKAELDREWQKIQKIIEKRKVPDSVGGSSSSKRPR